MTEEKAGFWLRVLALTIDEFILVIITFILLQAIKYFASVNLAQNLLYILLFYELLDYNYYTLFWVYSGQTPGKRIMKTKLIKVDGTVFTYKDAFIRYWIWMIGVALLGIGYLWIAWDKNKQGWNDIASKTYVIKL